MTDDAPATRLDRIATQWSLVQRAHENMDSTARAARDDLVMRYSAAIRKYVRAIVRHDANADELAQDFIVRMLRGDFSGADPARGRFRDFIKTAVRNMIRNHWAKERRRRTVDLDPAEEGVSDADQEDLWRDAWKDHVLELVWSAVRHTGRAQSDNVDAKLLELRGRFPHDSSDELAERLGKELGRTVRADAVRQKLRRARQRFAEQLLAEIAASLPDPSVDDVEQELIDLGIYHQVLPLLPDDWRETWK